MSLSPLHRESAMLPHLVGTETHSAKVTDKPNTGSRKIREFSGGFNLTARYC